LTAGLDVSAGNNRNVPVVLGDATVTCTATAPTPLDGSGVSVTVLGSIVTVLVAPTSGVV